MAAQTAIEIDGQVRRAIQLLHPEKGYIFSQLPAARDVDAAMLAPAYATTTSTLRDVAAGFREAAWQAARELLAEAPIRTLVDALPLKADDVVVALGDSITDDLQSWAEILSALLALRRPQDDVKLVNLGVSGDTTADLIARFLSVVELQPAWVLTLIGTNDARRHGSPPRKTMVSDHETEENLGAIGDLLREQTSAQLIWMTPPTVVEEQVRCDPTLTEEQVTFRNEDIAAKADAVRRGADVTVDLHAAFGDPPIPEVLRPDGVHPSLAGQVLITRALLDTWSARAPTAGERPS